MQSCQERSGFLFAHDCDHAASTFCAQCGKAVCQRHTRSTTQGDCCITCAKKITASEPDTDSYRRRYFNDPYWYHRHHYHDYHYDHHDRRAFDREQDFDTHEQFEDDIDGS